MIKYHQGGSRRSRVVAITSRVVGRPVLSVWPVRGPLAHTSRALDLALALNPRLPGLVHEPVAGETWRGELVRVQGSEPSPAAIVYFHGGAFVFCGVNTHRRITERLAQRTGLPVLSVAYRQRPRHTVDASIEDGLSAVQWLLAQGYDASRIVLAGDSAGGHLGFAVARVAAAIGVRLGGIVAFSPWLEFDNHERAAHPNARRDALIPTSRIEAISRHVVGTRTLDPSHSPVNGPFEHLPPVLMTASTDEVMLNDALKMEARLRAAGQPVELHIWPGVVHAFPVLAGALPESSAALDLATEFVQATVGRSATGASSLQADAVAS